MTTAMIVLTIANIGLGFLWARIIREWRDLRRKVRSDLDQAEAILTEIESRVAAHDLGVLSQDDEWDRVVWKQ